MSTTVPLLDVRNFSLEFRTRSGIVSALQGVDLTKILRAVLQRKGEAAVLLLKSPIEQSKLKVRKITLHALQHVRQRQA